LKISQQFFSRNPPHSTAEKYGKRALPLLSVVSDLLSCSRHLRALFIILRQLLAGFPVDCEGRGILLIACQDVSPPMFLRVDGNLHVRHDIFSDQPYLKET
jgi:hypothetical protein